MTDASRNHIFVIGDLVIDHTVIVQQEERHGGAKGPGYEVVRRISTAGGAANSARILAALNPGYTFLWGLIGNSVWGDFRQILEASQAIDGSKSAIKFRGIRDETNARMNTISRVLKVADNDDPKESILRFDDHGHVHVPEDKRKSSLHYLKRVHEKYRVHGVVIIDMDMNCLKPFQILDIAKFCEDENIPLYVNPRYDRKKYIGVEGTAIIASLDEWLSLVDTEDSKETWMGQLDHDDGLIRMAQLTLQHFSGFNYQVVLCGESGAVIVTPSISGNGKYEIFKAKPPQAKKGFTDPKLGSGDVATAVFAMEFSSSLDRSTQRVLEAFAKANVVVAAFQDTPGQRMPSRETATEYQENLRLPQRRIEWTAGPLYLPKEPIIQLSADGYGTRVPTVYSVDHIFRDAMNSFIDDVENEWVPSKLKSLILGAPSASGKSTILSQLEGDLGITLGVRCVRVKKPKEITWSQLDSFLDGLRAAHPSPTKLLIAIDEALKAPMVTYLKKYGVLLLNLAHDREIRFLFVDAGFTQERQLPTSSEFTSRCKPYHLPALTDRLQDTPYIIGGMLFKQIDDPKVRSIKADRAFLIALINQTISHPNLREIETHVESAYAKAIKAHESLEPLVMNLQHLPRNIASQSNDNTSHGIREFEFIRR